jgi:hypothetical protein
MKNHFTHITILFTFITVCILLCFQCVFFSLFPNQPIKTMNKFLLSWLNENRYKTLTLRLKITRQYSTYGYPSMRHITLASCIPKASPHTVPHVSKYLISTLPAVELGPLTSRMSVRSSGKSV